MKEDEEREDGGEYRCCFPPLRLLLVVVLNKLPICWSTRIPHQQNWTNNAYCFQ